jgi:SET domain
LTSAFGNTRGVYLHPYTARFNHSCDYNATYSFGRGGKCYVKAIRAIRKDEQVFVPYTDSTFSVGTRRRELYERFKFECKCSRCVREISTTSAAEVKARAAEEEEVNKAVDAIFKDSEKREDAGLALTTTRRLTSLLSSTAAKHDWDIVSRQRQPLASIRIDLMGAQILANKWKDLTLNAAIQHLRIDPDVYPDETHPVRRTNAFAFAQYAFYMLEGYRVRAGEDEGDDVMMRAEMNLGVLVWSIMSWVVRGRRYYSMPEYENASRRKAQKKNGNAKSIERAEDIIWPNPTFREEAVRFFGLVTRYCEEDGFERGMEMDNVIWRNWSSLERIIDSALEDEMGLPMTITTDESDL